jgi:hypothetical protein
MHFPPNGIGYHRDRPLAWFALRFAFVWHLNAMVYRVAYKVHHWVAEGF